MNTTAHNNTQHILSLQSTTLAQRPMCFGRKFIKGITAFVILSVANMTLLPLAQAVQTQRTQQRSAALVADTAATRYANLLGQLKGSVLTEEETAHASRPGNKRSSNFSADAFENLARQMQQESDELKKTWRAAGVDESVLQAQEQIDRALAEQHRQLLHALRSQNDGELAAFARASIPEPSHHRIDLDNMPWQVLKNQARQPLQTTEELNRALGLAPENAPRAEQGSAAQKTQPASTGPQQTTQRALPVAAEYAPTLDAPHTDDIKALAQSLNHDPHKIYQWVHDNIHYFPSHASVQGAQDTLDKKSGNAFDTASLLIALLRASGVPARYVYGTVDIPADKAMNWAGGAKTIDAAQQILGQGSVPNTALVSGGQVQTLRIEHIWVEAWIPYSPSRGAKTTAQSGHGWIPMDGSFKQYTFHEGMDLQATVPLDAQALLDAARQGAEINEAEGWVRNLNTTAVQNQLQAYQTQLETYINSQNGGNSTVGDVLGARKPQIDKLPWLAGSLPYKVQATAQRFSEIPNNLRAQFRYRIYRDAYSRLLDDAPLLNFQQPTVALAGKKLTLAWVAANPASQQALEALIPTPAPGQELQPDQLPRFIPHSISLKPEIRVDG